MVTFNGPKEEDEEAQEREAEEVANERDDDEAYPEENTPAGD